MTSVEFERAYGAMRHEELMLEAANLSLLRSLRREHGSAVVDLASRLISGAGRGLARLGRKMEAAGRLLDGRPVHG